MAGVPVRRQQAALYCCLPAVFRRGYRHHPMAAPPFTPIPRQGRLAEADGKKNSEESGQEDDRNG